MLKSINKVTFEITNNCNLNCRICNIWKEKNKTDLSLAQIKKVLDSLPGPLAIALTGGEPLLNPQINQIYKYLFTLFLRKKIKNIDIATNAYSNDLQNFLKNNLNMLKPLSFSISLDGINKTHNIQRGKKDAFRKTLNNILLIKKYNVPLALKFVISKLNYKDLYKVYRLAKKINVFLYIKFYEKLPNYYHRQFIAPEVSINEVQAKQVKKQLLKIMHQASTGPLKKSSLDYLINFIEDKNLDFIKTCLTPRNSLFVTAQGDVFSCIYQEKIGSLKKWPQFKLEGYQRIIKEARLGLCPKCLSYHGFLMSANLQ